MRRSGKALMISTLAFFGGPFSSDGAASMVVKGLEMVRGRSTTTGAG